MFRRCAGCARGAGAGVIAGSDVELRPSGPDIVRALALKLLVLTGLAL